MKKKIRYKKTLPIICLTFSVAIMFVSIMQGYNKNLVSGIIGIILGALFLVNPMVEYSENEVRIKNLIGITLKRYLLDQGKIDINGDEIYYNGEKIKLWKQGLNQEDLQEFIRFVTLVSTKK